MKKEYLVVYECNSGGVWALIWARPAEEIHEKYPDLNVLEQRPAWMQDVQ
jgi:hypothetical protein